jgi:adenylate kinase family enzyme
MSNSVLIMGESGTGKSTSLRNLDHEKTFIINVIGKPLPFKGAKSKYIKLSPDGLTGNYYASDDPMSLQRVIKLINLKRLDIENLIIDDFGYTITNSFMRKAILKGYDKYNDIGKETFDILESVVSLRDDLFCAIMMHTEIDNHGRHKPKTVGKMIDQYICIEGKFTNVLHALTSEGKYQFLTNNDGRHMAKTPLEMFDSLLIDNDLQYVRQKISEFE